MPATWKKPLRDQPAAVRWLVLVVLSLALAGLAQLVRLPAALMLGPMVAAVIIGATEARLRVGRDPFLAAQGLLGCMIGSAIPLSVVDELLLDWPIFLAGTFSVILAAGAMGLILTRRGAMPGTTAIWGTSPGASTAMIVMSEAYGGDMRLVAVMQNLRIIVVVMVAALVARLSGSEGASVGLAHAWFPPIRPLALLMTVAIAAGGVGLAFLLRIPAGAILLPMAATIGLTGTTGMTLDLPPWLLAVSYAIVGWSIGLRFTRATLINAWRLLPLILGTIFLLVAVCGLIALAMVRLAGIEPLTAFLATCPGGVDSVAIIAASSHADIRFVMAMQTTRLVVVMLTSPLLARWLARRQGLSKGTD